MTYTLLLFPPWTTAHLQASPLAAFVYMQRAMQSVYFWDITTYWFINSDRFANIAKILSFFTLYNFGIIQSYDISFIKGLLNTAILKSSSFTGLTYLNA